MPKIRVTKEFHFEMAHALWNYDGLCKNIHGHSYILFVTVIGEPITENNNPKIGMVIDFGDLKKIVNSTIVNKFDHCVVLSSKAPSKHLLTTEEMFERYEILNYQPTCENMVIDFAERIKSKLPDDVKLFSIKLHETANSFAEWFASDNE
ncbi:MAG: 6-carboxytetrahydropterin synthase [Bacteroidales bacterium]|nr:6-carboxytetrahydropterin synthase [Bacteroidales bacterium]MBN2756387.1 6-carboxytetrahydropterin synthase [Bacteroidales bacterium]